MFMGRIRDFFSARHMGKSIKFFYGFNLLSSLLSQSCFYIISLSWAAGLVYVCMSMYFVKLRRMCLLQINIHSRLEKHVMWNRAVQKVQVELWSLGSWYYTGTIAVLCRKVDSWKGSRAIGLTYEVRYAVVLSSYIAVHMYYSRATLKSMEQGKRALSGPPLQSLFSDLTQG